MLAQSIDANADHPLAHVDGDDDARAKGGDNVVEEVDVAERGGDDNRALGAGP